MLFQKHSAEIIREVLKNLLYCM